MASKLCIISIFVFDIIAFVLAIGAEQKRSIGHVQIDNEVTYQFCVYGSDVATGLGVGAYLFLMASQVLMMAATGCLCCGSPLNPGASRTYAALLFIFCWISFFIAAVCLLVGSVGNAFHFKHTTLFVVDPPSCETVRKGVFAAGAAFVLVTAVISKFYYINYSKAAKSSTPYEDEEAGVGMVSME